MTCKCDPVEVDGHAYNQFIGSYFYDCVYSTSDIVAFSSGLLSILIYIVSMLPQLYKNYRRKKVDGLSLTFLMIWVFGDLANACGAVFTQQFPTVQYTGIYFVFSDAITIAQYVYYYSIRPRWHRRKQLLTIVDDATVIKHTRNGGDDDNNDIDEVTPLIYSRDGQSSTQNYFTTTNDYLDGDDTDFNLHRDRSQTLETSRTHRDSMQSVKLLGGSRSSLWIVCLAIFCSLSMAHQSSDIPSSAAMSRTLMSISDQEEQLCDFMPVLGKEAEYVGIAMAWISGILYLLSRLPQIKANYRMKTVEGLSLTLFVLTISANLTYGLAIMLRFPPVDDKFWQSVFPFLMGSLGTLFFDLVIIGQAFAYGNHDPSHPISKIKQAFKWCMSK